MQLGKNILENNRKPEAIKYQHSFDLRKNLAKVISLYAQFSIQKNITLDIYVAHETPNYYHGNVHYFLEMISNLLKLSIASMDNGEIYIRVYHDSIHQTNDCETELSICITTRSNSKVLELPDSARHFNSAKLKDSKIPLANCSTFHRIKKLCCLFDGDLTLNAPDSNNTEYILSCVLQQAHPVGRLHLV